MKKEEKMLCLFPDIFEMGDMLTDEQFGILMRSVAKYAFEGIPYDGEDPLICIAYRFVAGQVERYEEHRQEMKRIAALGGKRKAELHKLRQAYLAGSCQSIAQEDSAEDYFADSASISLSQSLS